MTYNDYDGAVPRVFVTQEPRSGVDISSALEHGQLETILKQTNNIRNTARAAQIINDVLHDFTENDFILALGDPVVIGIVCAAASRRTNGRFTILKWDRQEQCYFPIKVDLNQ